MRAAGLALGVVVLGGLVGFIAGFAWGQGTRSALGDSTQTNFSGGVLTVSVNAKQALTAGLQGIFG